LSIVISYRQIIHSKWACGKYLGEEKQRGIWFGQLKKRYHLEDLGSDGRIILKWILKTGINKLKLLGSGYGQVMGSCEQIINLWIPQNGGNL
jgi:hypothetical protein